MDAAVRRIVDAASAGVRSNACCVPVPTSPSGVRPLALWKLRTAASTSSSKLALRCSGVRKPSSIRRWTRRPARSPLAPFFMVPPGPTRVTAAGGTASNSAARASSRSAQAESMPG